MIVQLRRFYRQNLLESHDQYWLEVAMKRMWQFARRVFLTLSCLSLVVGVQAQSLVISEIQYHPLDGLTPGSTNIIDGDEFEFLEIRNAGATPYDLNGCSVSGGITFTFSGTTTLNPGESTVIAENSIYFAYRYPWVTGIAGQYSGKLSNGGEALVLKNSSGVQLFAVTYDDANGWPEEADGHGRSLMLSNPAGDPNDPANWCASAELHGSPTATGTCQFTDIVINEVLAHSDPPLEDAVELYNLSGSPIDLNGWYLSDDLIQPKKYRITGSVIGTEAYTVFYEYQFNENPPADTNNTPFALSSLGDELVLSAPFPDSQRLRLVDSINFGATVTDVSLGRFPNGSGAFEPLASLTFGTTNPATVEIFRSGTGAYNSAPRTSPIVINEIMYHPTQDNEEQLEYIELLNVSDTTYDISGWVLDGVNYTNPPGTFMVPGEFLVICADQTEIFNTYGITNTLGNWPGRLQNGGERITLQTDEGAVIDSVRYNDKEPWPAAADGYGPSLERIRATDQGDSYMNWQASRNGTEWEQVVITQSVAVAGMTSLKFWIDYEGKCYLDDVSVQPLGGGAEALSNGDFELAGTSWNFNGNHLYSRTEVGAGVGGTIGLGAAGNYTRVLLENGGVILYFGNANGNNVESDPFYLDSGNYVLSFRILRSGPAQNFHSALGGVTQSYQLGNYGTPGTVNSTASELNLLGIADTAADNAVVFTGVPNTIRAQIEGHFTGAAVNLYYRPVYPGSYQFTDVHYTEMTMADDGILPDLVAGDGEFAATVPGVITNWTIVRYHITAVGTDGFAARSPTIDNPSMDRAYWVQGNPMQITLPNWHVVSDGSPIVYSNSYRCCAVSPDGEVFTDLRVRHRGRPETATAERSGLALRMNRDQLYDAFFANNQEGINFRHRQNNFAYLYDRVVNEYLGYLIQQKIGLATPHLRHICLWVNGAPTITTELEAPDTGFLDLHGLDKADYISRSGYSGRRIVDGDQTLDNFNTILSELASTTGAVRAESIRTNLWYESIRYSMALMSITANADQHFEWNMFQHRLSRDGRWAQYPWDVDKAFLPVLNSQDMTILHPYYMTPDHPSVWNASIFQPLGETLFYPEDSPYTLPYRYRQQMSLWRYCHTLFTTNCIYPILDKLQADLSPAYTAIGVSKGGLTNKVASVKTFIVNRRDFLMNGSWSDKDTNIWSVADYDPTTLVINEIMYNPATGSEYIGLYNSGSNTLDLSWWLLRVGAESYRLPHGTMVGPGSELVIADTYSTLTNAYPELRNPASLAQRYPGMPIWDWPLDFYTNMEYSTRIVDIQELTLPNTGASIDIYDICSNLIDTVTYSAAAPWPITQGASLELVDASLDNSMPLSWRSSFIGGSPATGNTADNDLDNDGMIDSWESRINANIELVLPDGDDDSDDLPNGREFTLGTDPTVDDAAQALIDIAVTDGDVVVGFNTFAVSGTGYDLFSKRLYTLESALSLQPTPVWSNVLDYVELPGYGVPIIYTNTVPESMMFFRYKARLDRKVPQ